MNNALRSNAARNGGPKKSNGQKKAKRGVNLRQATSSLSIPSSASSQMKSGIGSYMAPTSIASQQRQRGPRSQTRFDGKSIIIKRRELIGSISGSTSFSVRKYAVNPGIASTFPLLSVQAPQWEQYRFRKLAFEYITRTATTTLGSVIMAPDYDAEDVSPASEAQITGYEGAVEDAPWKNISSFIDCNAISPGPRKFIRSGAVAGDIKNYDALNFFVATLEEVGTDAIGKLWVDYEVELSVPQNSPSDQSGPTRVSYFRRAAAQTFASTINEAIDWDAAISDPLGIGNDTTGDFKPPKGVYKMDYRGSFSNTVNENTTGVMTIFKNGAAAGADSIFRLVPGLVNGQVQLSGSTIVSCNGTDIVSVMINMTGATGALTVIANTTEVQFSVV